MDRIIKSNAFKILLVFILFTAFLFSGVTMDVHADTIVTDEAGLIEALNAGGDIDIVLGNDIVLTSGINISSDTRIILDGHTIETNFSSPFPDSAISSSANIRLEIMGPGTVDLSAKIGLKNYAGSILVSGGAILKSVDGSLADTGVLSVGNGSQFVFVGGGILDGNFSGAGKVEVGSGGHIEGQNLTTKEIIIIGTAKLAKISPSDSLGSVVINGAVVDAYNPNSGVQIGGGSTTQISAGAVINNASSIGGNNTKLTIDSATVNGRTEKGVGATISGDTEVKGASQLQVNYFYGGNTIIGGESVITFDNDQWKNGSFQSVISVTFKDTPTLRNMSAISPYNNESNVYLYQDAGASFDFQEGFEGITVSLGYTSGAMIHIKDQTSGLPGAVYYQGDIMPADFAVYEGTVTRDTAHFTAFKGHPRDSATKLEVLESGENMLQLSAPACKIVRNGEDLLFYTIEDAFAAAKQGETIEVLRDLGYEGSITLDPASSNGVTEYTLELAGFTISHSPQGYYDNDHVPFVVYSGMTLNIVDSSDGQTGCIQTYDYEYPMIFNAGTVNIDGGIYYGLLCGASYNGGPEDRVPGNTYQSIGSDGKYVIREAYLYHDKTDAIRQEADVNPYSLESLSFITIAERSAIDEDFIRGNYHGGYYPYTHIKRLTVSLTFDANGGNGSMDALEPNAGEKTTLPKCTMTRDGYIFKGWNKKADGTGTSYNDEGEYTPIVDTVLYAQWEKDPSVTLYTVKFDANGGKGTMDAQEIEEGKPTALTSNTITREGYSFTGWNTVADGSGTAYKDGQEVTLEKDITLYAQWKDESGMGVGVSIVTFDSNGGQGTMEAQYIEGGTETALTACSLTREGYTFAGWNTAADGSGTAYADGAKVTLDNDVTLYAQWKEEQNSVKYTITFELNGGTMNGKTGFVTVQAESGEVITLPSAERSGYTFDYWEGSRYDAGSNYTVTGDHTFTAQWKENTAAAQTDTGNKGDAPATGDNSNIGLMSVIMVAAICAAGVVTVLLRKIKNR